MRSISAMRSPRSSRRSPTTVAAKGRAQAEVVEEGNCVTGELRFCGYHRRECLASLLRAACVVVRAPIFTFQGGKMRDLWVLSDLHGVIERLRAR